ncbi:MAG: hypothetical protein IJC78_05445 [Clostridia bacterium]|nr:hypothetical protein [Clostridia bacterium]
MSEMAEEKKNRKKQKKGLWITLFVILGIIVLLAGYVGYRYLFPSDKELIVLAHYNSLHGKEKQEEAPFFQKSTDISWDMEGAFVEPDLTERLESLSIHTEQSVLVEGDGVYRFAFRMGEQELFQTERVNNGGLSYVGSDALTDGTYYCADEAKELWELLLGRQGIRTDVKILDGVDKETFSEYLKTYGMELYRMLPDSAFSRTETEQGTELVLSGDAAWLLSDVVSQIKSDYALKNFLYTQWDQIIKNIHATYTGAELLVPSVSQAEFEADYDEALQTFLMDLAEKKMQLKLTVLIDEDRRVISDSLLLSAENAPVLEFTAHQDGSYRLVPYTDGVPNFMLERSIKTEGTLTESATLFTMDVNEYSKSPSETDKKMVTISVVSHTDTDVSGCTAEVPAECVMLAELDETAKEEVAEKTNQKLSELTTQLMFMIAVSD